MLRKLLFLALATALATLLTSSQAHAWGAYHRGYTSYGAGGFSHTSQTTMMGPRGAVYEGGRTTTGYGSYGGYHSSYGYGYGGYHPTYGGGYGGSSYHYGYGSAYGGSGGVYTSGYRTGGVWVP
jgi:hypothetical protein